MWKVLHAGSSTEVCPQLGAPTDTVCHGRMRRCGWRVMRGSKEAVQAAAPPRSARRLLVTELASLSRLSTLAPRSVRSYAAGNAAGTVIMG